MRLRKMINTMSKNFRSHYPPNELYNINPKALELYRGFIDPGDLCFDVGANIGNRTNLFLQLGAKVVAIEPQLECIKILKKYFGGNPDFVLIPEALGSQAGDVEMYINTQANTISSLSKEWIDEVKQSGRFSAYTWNQKQNVKVNTLDHLISKYGVPKFIKIDVEGYEREVLLGLSSPVPYLSIEFTPERLQPTYESLQYLSSMGPTQFNVSLNESMMFEFDQWVDLENILSVLENLKDNLKVFGDVYIRFEMK